MRPEGPAPRIFQSFVAKFWKQRKITSSKTLVGANFRRQERKESSIWTYLEGAAWSSMRPFMKLARLAEASLTAAASLEMESFCMSSSSTLTDFWFSVMVTVGVWVLFVIVGIVVSFYALSSIRERAVYNASAVEVRRKDGKLASRGSCAKTRVFFFFLFVPWEKTVPLGKKKGGERKKEW